MPIPIVVVVVVVVVVVRLASVAFVPGLDGTRLGRPCGVCAARLSRSHSFIIKLQMIQKDEVFPSYSNKSKHFNLSVPYVPWQWQSE